MPTNRIQYTSIRASEIKLIKFIAENGKIRGMKYMVEKDENSQEKPTKTQIHLPQITHGLGPVVKLKSNL